MSIDLLGPLKVAAGSDPSQLFKISQNKTIFQVKIVKIATGGTVGLAKWIIVDTCPVIIIFSHMSVRLFHFW